MISERYQLDFDICNCSLVLLIKEYNYIRWIVMTNDTYARHIYLLFQAPETTHLSVDCVSVGLC